MSALLLPLPLGLAISRYALFDVATAVRRLVARLLYVASAALAMTALFVVISVRHPDLGSSVDPIALFLMFFAFAAAIELAGGYGLVETIVSPETVRLRELRGRFVNGIGELRSHEEITRLLSSTIMSGLRPRSGCVFLRAGHSWRPARSFGRAPPIRIRLVHEALMLRGDKSALTVSPNSVHAKESSQLEAADVRLVVGLGSREEPSGLLLLTGSSIQRAYSEAEVEFAGTVADHAGLALYNADLALDLVANERHATAGRVAVALAHDLAKDLDWIERLTERLPGRLADWERASRDLSLLGELVQELRGTVHTFVEDSTRHQTPTRGAVELDRLIQSAVDLATRRHEHCRITYTLVPHARGVRAHENLLHVLVNLLDNALHASSTHDAVHIFCTCDNSLVRIAVTDNGPGIAASIAESVFEAGFSTRHHRGGMGTGLTISRDIVSSLSGTLELEAAPGGGTRAVVSVPEWESFEIR
jgi:signal transduction histidine kinase